MYGVGIRTLIRSLHTNLWRRMEGVRLLSRQGMGAVFFVNGGSIAAFGAGVNVAGRGTTPDRPFSSIQYAIDQCVTGRGDFIYCWNVYNQDTFPINVNKDNVHIIGIAAPNGQPALLAAHAADNVACFNFPQDEGENSEIAGFNMGAGVDHACIELQGSNAGVWIHHNEFGQLWSEGGQDGIGIGLAPGVVHGLIVEDNWFYGTKHGAGKLTRHGIVCLAGYLTQGTIRRNYFLEMPGDAANGTGGAIYVATSHPFDQCVIENNYIGGGNDAATGWGIYLGADSHGNLVCGNEANDGKTVAVSSPYVDESDNNWISNQWGILIVHPETGVA